MIAVGHTSVGTLIGIGASSLAPEVPLPAVVLLTGVVGWLSHYAMDLVPHGHYPFNQTSLTTKQKLTFLVDFGLPLVVLAIWLLAEFGFGRQSWLVGAGVMGAQLPDILMGLRSKRVLPRNFWQFESYWHSRTHWHNPKEAARATPEGGRQLGWSDLWQAAVAVLAILLLVRG